MRRKVFLAMGIAAAMLVSSCGGADAPSSGSSTSTPAERVSTPAEGQTSPEPTATEPAILTATGEIDGCRATGEAVLSISGGELLAPWPKKGDVVDCTVRPDDSTLAGGKVEARLPNKLLRKVAQGGSVSYKVKADYVLWSGAGMWAQVEVVSTTAGDWEVTRVLST